MPISYRAPATKHAIELRPTHVRYDKFPRRLFNLRSGGRRGCTYFAGNGIYTLLAHRNQRCIVKISYTRNTKTRSWAAHGEYLQREHAQNMQKKGLGFNDMNDAIDLKKTLRLWQQAEDPHVFKLIVSPEKGYELNLKQHTKELMKFVQKDLQTKLEWAAIDHHNTDYPHLHILICGIDENGKALVIERDYLTHGFRHRSEEVATRVLGKRLHHEITHTREHQLEREYVTELDRILRHKSVNSIVTYDTPVPDNILAREKRLLEIKRLKFLETLTLAERVSAKSWKLSDTLEATLQERQLSNDIIKSQARHNVRTLT